MKNNILAGIGLVAATTLLAEGGNEKEQLDVEVCQTLAAGRNLPDAKSDLFYDMPIDLQSRTSLDASVAKCSIIMGTQVKIECAAKAILTSIKSGKEIARPLIEDARTIKGECK